MASFSVDITDIRFAGARTGYKVVTISNAPAGGISIANTGYGTYYRVIVREANRYYEIQTKGTCFTASGGDGTVTRNSVVRFYNTADSTDYVEVNICQAVAKTDGSEWFYYDDTQMNAIYIGDLYFENTSSTKRIYIDYASGVSGEVLSGSDWLSVIQGTPAVTDTGFLYFNISVISNYDSTRNGQIKFSNADDSYYTVSDIEQAGGAATDVLAVTPSSIEFSASGGSRGITLDYRGTAYNMDMSAVMSWVDISMSSVMTGLATGVVTVGSNTGTSQRSGIVYISDNGSPSVPAVELNITQAAPVETLTVSPSSLSFSSSGETKTLAVTYMGTLNTNRDNKPDWLAMSETEGNPGTSGRTYTIEAYANNTSTSRSFDFVLQDDYMTKTVPITQAAGLGEYSVSPSSISFSSSSGTRTVSLYYPEGGLYDNSVSSRPNWVTVDFGSGNPASVLITVEANTGLSRSGSVVFYNSTMQDSCTLVVSQDSGSTGPSFSVSPSVVSFTASGGTQSLVFTDTPSGGLSYEVLSGSSWLSFSFVNDVVTASSNSSSSSRTGSIKFWNQDDPDDYVVVGVEQAGYVPVTVLSVSPASKSFAYTGGSQVFNITYSDSLSFNTLPSWLSGEVSYIVVGESARYTMTAAENTSTSSRSFSWVISDESSSVTVQIYQAGSPGPGPVPVTDGNLRASKTRVVIGPNSDATVELYGVHSSGYRYTIDYQDGSGWCSVSSYNNYVVISRIGDNTGTSKIAKIRFYQQDDASDYVDVWVTNAGDTNIIHKVWRGFNVYPADRVPGENYHYRIMLDNSTNIYEGIAVAPSSSMVPNAVDIAGVARDYSVILRRTPDTPTISRNLTSFGYPVDLYVYNGDTDEYITRAEFWENYDNIYYGDVRDNICYAQVLNDPVNSKGCPGMVIPFCVYEDDSSRSYSVVTDSGVDSLNISTVGFLMNNYKYDNTGYVEYKRGDETVMKYDMNHCGKAYLWYLNRLGGWDVFLIEGNIYKKENYTRDGYKLNVDTGSYYGYKGQKQIARTNIDTVYEFSTGWMTDDESERFVYHMLSSGFVWLKFIEEEYKYDVQMIPVIILDTSAEYKKFRNGKRLVNYTVTVEAANTKRLQS